MVTTTPRPTRLIKELVADPTVVITRGSTYDNRANLAGAFLKQIVQKYEARGSVDRN
jgi:phage terminase large subunit-like protein